MPQRRAAPALAVLLCLGLLCAWPSGLLAASAAQAPPAGQGSRLVLAAFHLRHEGGGGPLAALEVLDAPRGGVEAAADGAPADDTPADEAGELALRALAYRQLGRNAEAVAALNRLMLLRRDLPPAALADAFTERGQALGALGHQARAAEDFAAALALAPRHVPALMARADQAFALGQAGEAEAGYSLVLQAEPENVPARINRGVALDEQGRYQEAIADFTRALELEPDSAVALANRGVSRSQAGDMVGMCADYASACRLGACHRLGAAQAMGYCRDGR
ncbi:MAG: tetratricopeptide repeat protein [Proteobacteria bacterium]|nr:tetratricopeptide repeat protein [Pseudomonadota bacterium]MBU1594109.1 tetratricopeptide repeat protein [Pseudomonadota bacterium]